MYMKMWHPVSAFIAGIIGETIKHERLLQMCQIWPDARDLMLFIDLRSGPYSTRIAVELRRASKKAGHVKSIGGSMMIQLSFLARSPRVAELSPQ